MVGRVVASFDWSLTGDVSDKVGSCSGIPVGSRDGLVAGSVDSSPSTTVKCSVSSVSVSPDKNRSVAFSSKVPRPQNS